ncbi:MAG: internal scaffolding protein [Microvirus sp.]|nr:MAG: internal scaffolding protein [Microvirus sp.]
MAKPIMEPNPKISTRYDYASIDRPGVDFDQSNPNSRSVTNQSDKDSTDINKIMERYEKTGLIPDALTGLGRKPHYGDFSNVGNFHELQDTLAKVNQAFAVLPAPMRSQFGNDPQNLIEFLANPENDAQAIAMGLKNKPVAAEEAAPATKSDPSVSPADPAAPPAKPTVGSV